MLTFVRDYCLLAKPGYVVQNETPPIIPKIRDPKDLSQYRRMPDDEAASANPSATKYSEDTNPENPFVNFNMLKDESLRRQY